MAKVIGPRGQRRRPDEAHGLREASWRHAPQPRDKGPRVRREAGQARIGDGLGEEHGGVPVRAAGGGPDVGWQDHSSRERARLLWFVGRDVLGLLGPTRSGGRAPTGYAPCHRAPTPRKRRSGEGLPAWAAERPPPAPPTGPGGRARIQGRVARGRPAAFRHPTGRFSPGARSHAGAVAARRARGCGSRARHGQWYDPCSGFRLHMTTARLFVAAPRAERRSRDDRARGRVSVGAAAIATVSQRGPRLAEVW